MAKTFISNDMLHLGLKQLGADSLQTTNTKLSVVKFKINDKFNVSYLFYVKDEEKIYLQRLEPYPFKNYHFTTVEHILKFVAKDVEQFKNAANSSNFELFLLLINKNYELRGELEELFLLNNVPKEFLEEIKEDGRKLLKKIKNAEHIALKNDPGRYRGEEVRIENMFDGDNVDEI